MKSKTGKNRKIIVYGSIVALVISSLCVYIALGKIKEKKYISILRTAEKNLVVGDYENAIVAYKEAIDIDEKEVDPYLSLANIYAKQNKIEDVAAILTLGLEKTNSAKIQYMINTMSFTGVEKLSNAYSDSKDIAWNTSFVQKLEYNAFYEFVTEFGETGENVLDENKILSVVHKNFGGIFFYRNTNQFRSLVDVSSKRVANTAMPYKIQLNSIQSLFKNYNGIVSHQYLELMMGTRVKTEMYEEKTVVVLERENSIIRIECDENGNIVSPYAWCEIDLINANDIIKNKNVMGVVLDAVTGKGVKEAEMTFTDKKNNYKPVTTTTQVDGSFGVKLNPSLYSVTINAHGYTVENFELRVEKGKIVTGEQFVISGELVTGEARIVLEWNAQPQDLDSYLQGETKNGTKINVSYDQKTAKENGKVIATLDVDDTDGYGPETTTIHDLKGTYVFRVANFKSCGKMANTSTIGTRNATTAIPSYVPSPTYIPEEVVEEEPTIGTYGATVKVYLPGKDVKVITLNTSAGIVDLWEVCTIKNGELIENNGVWSGSSTSTTTK